MRESKHTPEQIISLLREADVEPGKGCTVREVRRKLGIQSSGMKVDQAKLYKELYLGNNRLKKLVADLYLNKMILQEVRKGIFFSSPGKFLIVNWC